MNSPCSTCKHQPKNGEESCPRGASLFTAQHNGWCAKYNLPWPHEANYLEEAAKLEATLPAERMKFVPAAA